MFIDFFTIILGLFTLVLYSYLYLVQKSIRIKSQKASTNFWFLFLISTASLIYSFLIGHQIKGVLAALILLSFLIDARGLSEDRIIASPFDRTGTLYSEIDRIVLLLKNEEIKMNYFKNGHREPMLKFSGSLEELLEFLASRLNKQVEIDILIDEE
ncbi:hypothetical protein ACYSNW_13940 [Enterococcus sp. LJL99]